MTVVENNLNEWFSETKWSHNAVKIYETFCIKLGVHEEIVSSNNSCFIYVFVFALPFDVFFFLFFIFCMRAMHKNKNQNTIIN